MSRLYLMIGYPGAGKTSVSKAIAEATGAVHVWSDVERHKMFPEPTHSTTESLQLYDHLNNFTEELLSQGKSVIFDTNFNFAADREKLREIANRQGAETVVVWVNTPAEVAKTRAVGVPMNRNGYTVSMSEEQFNSIVSKLEPPTDNENVIKIDGTDLDVQAVKAQFSQ